MENATIILRQMLIMFLYIGIGYWLYKKKLVTKEGSKSLAHLLLYVILPCVIVQSFCSNRGVEGVETFIVSIFLGLFLLLLMIAIARIVFKQRPIDHFGSAFSNAGFMGTPLITALIGVEAVVYVVGFIAFLNIFQWFYGQSVLAEKKLQVRLTEILKNPLIISFFVGVVLMLGNVKLPSVMEETVRSLAGLNAPIAMVILGVYLAQTNIGSLFLEKELYIVSIIRLLVMPVLAIIILTLCRNLPYEMRLALLIASSAPIGSNVAVYAQKLNKNYIYAVKTVCLSTLLSIVTMPLCIYIAECLWR